MLLWLARYQVCIRLAQGLRVTGLGGTCADATDCSCCARPDVLLCCSTAVRILCLPLCMLGWLVPQGVRLPVSTRDAAQKSPA